MLRTGPILLIRTGALGDLVQFSAVIAALADHHDQPVDVLTSGGFADQALLGMPEIGRLFAVRHRRRPSWLAPDLQLLARTLAKRGYSEVYAFDRAPVIERALVAGGALVHTELDSSAEHAMDHFLAVLTRLGVAAPQPFVPCMSVRHGDRQAAQELIQRHQLSGRPLIVIQPGNSRTLHPLHRLRPQRNLKSWPTAKWIATVEALALSHPEVGFVLAGAPSEWGICEEIKSGLPAAIAARCANLANELPVRSLIGILDSALGCVSVDTGPAHLAAAVGCPVVVLFGPADPAAMAPRGKAPVRTVVSGVACSPCYGTTARDACRDNQCMRLLSVVTVLSAWAEIVPQHVRLRIGA
jgi:ADP-heptose:LPS heptosyltransferase